MKQRILNPNYIVLAVAVILLIIAEVATHA